VNSSISKQPDSVAECNPYFLELSDQNVSIPLKLAYGTGKLHP
jgi:hypothetical protein